MIMPVPLLLRVHYFLLDYPNVIAPELILQMEDIVPSIPKVNRFLERLQRNTGVRYASIEVSGGNLGRGKSIRHADGMFQLH